MCQQPERLDGEGQEKVGDLGVMVKRRGPRGPKWKAGILCVVRCEIGIAGFAGGWVEAGCHFAPPWKAGLGK